MQIEFKQLASLGDQHYPSFELRHILNFLCERGHAQWCQTLCADLDLSCFKHLFNDQESEDAVAEFIPSHIALEAMARVVDSHFDIGLGLDVAKSFQLSDFGDLGIALRNAHTLHDALNIALGYYELLGSFTDLTLMQSEQDFTIRLVNVSGLNENLLHLLFELTVSGMVSIGKEISDREIDTTVIRVRHSLSADQKQGIAEQFGCQVEDNADFHEWVVSLASIEEQIERPDQSEAQLDESIVSLNELLQSLRNEYALVDRFDQLARQDDTVFPNSKEIADALHMSERTFRRKLGKIGVNYNLLMSKIRCQLAITMLQRGGHTNEDIAFELGFSDAANFCNAFKKWTGNTPNFYRI